MKRRFKDQWKFFIQRLKSRNFWIIISADIYFILMAYFFANFIRFEDAATLPFEKIKAVIPLIIVIKLPSFYFFGLYRGMWRYTSLDDLRNIGLATVASSVILVNTVLYLTHFIGYSRSVFILDAVFTFLFICASRGLVRVFYEQYCKRTKKDYPETAPKKRLLLIGAGSAAEKVIREIRENTKIPYNVVGLVDDNLTKIGLKIHGIPVLGTTSDLDECIRRTRADELLISIAAASGDQMKRIIDVCQASDLEYSVLPSIGEIITGDLSVSKMREVDYRDLLGRPAVKLNQQEIGSYLTGKTILVTGAGGSIGSELCRQILGFKPSKIILFDAGEENLYKIQMEMYHDHNFHHIVPVLGKIQNRALLDDVFSRYKPTAVFHAAAYKHVPLVEINPWEAAFNNVFAVRNIIETSICHGVERFVLVSTDKAVRPTNVMGASKRVTELLMLAYCNGRLNNTLSCRVRKNGNNGVNGTTTEAITGHKTKFMAVRFGNVLGSSGSVIPLFTKQITMGGPVTVTHPEMTRYFMSIDEAAQLILQAGAMGDGGEIFLLKMGEPVKIDNLAKDLIKLSGKKVGDDIEIKYVGLRPGEKLYEELITEGEGIVETGHEKIMVLRGEDKNYLELQQDLENLAAASKQHNSESIKASFSQLVPEYKADVSVESVV